MVVTLILRKAIPEYFSIENVFSIILQPLRKKISANVIHAPTNRAHPLAVLKNIRSLRKTQADVIHVTGDIHYAVFAFPSKKVVLTIHDSVFLRNTRGLSKFLMLWFWYKLPVWHARSISTISEASKKDIIKLTGCSPSKITVIGNPVDPDFRYHPAPFNVIKPVILQIGTWTNKNLERVVEAIQTIPCQLVIIGKLSDEQKQLIAASGIDYSNSFFLSKEALIQQYINCDMVVFVSLFEGFGLPVLEAQATGRPLVTSAISPMKEVAGKGAHLADPYDVDAIRAGIKKVIQDEQYRKQLIEEGLENVKRFNAEAIAEKYFELYNRVVSG